MGYGFDPSSSWKQIITKKYIVESMYYRKSSSFKRICIGMSIYETTQVRHALSSNRDIQIELLAMGRDRLRYRCFVLNVMFWYVAVIGCIGIRQ